MSKDAPKRMKRTLSPAVAFTTVFTAVAGAVTSHAHPDSKGRARGSALSRLMTFSLALALLLSTAAPLAPQAAAHGSHNGNANDNSSDANSWQPSGNQGQDQWQPSDNQGKDQGEPNASASPDTSSNQQTGQPANTDTGNPTNQPSNGTSGPQGGGHFSTLPPGSKLPTGAECASRVRRSPWEPRSDNYKANHTTGKTGVQINGANAQGESLFAPRIDGNFTGTTDEIIQWGACKWGFDEDIVRAVAVNESTWHQSEVGDGGQSYGLLQIKGSVHTGTFPTSQDSTPFNVDYALAWRRSCFEGYFDWAKMGPQTDEWPCIGLWFSGNPNPNGGADNYIANAKKHLQEKPWLSWKDESGKLPADANQSNPAPDSNAASQEPNTNSTSSTPDATSTTTNTNSTASDNPAEASPSPSDTPNDTNAANTASPADGNTDANVTQTNDNADTGNDPSGTDTKHHGFSISAFVHIIFELCDPRSWWGDNNPSATGEPSTDTPPTDKPGSGDSHLLIYDNAVAPQFADGTFGAQSSEPCDKTTFVSEPCSYAAAFQASGAYDFQVMAADGLKTDPYLALEFNLNTGGQPIEDFAALFTDMNDKIVNKVVLSKDHVVKTLDNGWVHVVVPISDLNPSKVPVLTIQIKNVTQNQLQTVHLDDVQLSGNTQAAVPLAPTGSESPSPSSSPAGSPAPSGSTTPAASSAPVESNTPAESSAPTESNAPAESPAGNESPAPSTAPVTQTGSDISGLHVQGNQLLNGAGQAVRLRGVNHSGTEYQCIHGDGIFEGPNDDGSVKAIKSWKANVVRVPMNEDCWLAINGAPDQYSGAKYQQAIKDYVDLLTKNGMATILELHWTAPGGEKATGQKPMLDKDHSVEFWKQVAGTFKDNQSVIFDPHNEPYPDGNKDTDAAWTCWRDGGTCSGLGFQAAGMQEIVNTIRAAGAKNVVMLGGVQYSNGLSQWLKYKPNDPQNNLMASWHVYPFNPCKDTACFDKNVKPVMAQVPLMAGEIGQDDCGNGFINDVMKWLDQNGGGYAAWVWNTWGSSCGSISLISNYDGTPNGQYGQGYKDHLASQ